MGTPFLGEIRLASFNFAAKSWALCNGQLLPINQNQALFSLLGTTYGGDGQVSFALPDLRACMPMHAGQGHELGERAGQAAHTLTQSELPAHSHAPAAAATPGAVSPESAHWASPAKPAFAATPDTTLAANLVSSAGGSQAHTNLPPYLTINFMIALAGIFPSRD
ncbi:phage tail protein [Cryobacterium glaciale]|uniref:Phage tail protein n=1 Tax=Cryobacterium glaciale TaxID=1259145 RepID=A0A4R8UZP4_9MICO|nr:tail fiber protein [Cryobacterium glaciale]TFB75340.1 phage tail protein [Cryobacterium glaciale]